MGNYLIAKASVKYKCSICGKTIDAGENYRYRNTGKYIYHYCMPCDEASRQAVREGFKSSKYKWKMVKCSELIKKYGAMDAQELKNLVDHTGSLISLARQVNNHFPQIKYERFVGGGHGNRGDVKRTVKGHALILFVDRNEMYRILKEKFNVQKISQIMPRSARWKEYSLYCMTEPNAKDKGIIAYVGRVYDYKNEIVYSIVGSARYPWQRVVTLDVLTDMTDWCFANVHHGSIINIYTCDLDGAVRRDVHDFVSPSIVLRDTLVMKLKWFARFNIRAIQPTEYFDKLKCMVLDEAHLNPDEALHANRQRLDVGKHPMPHDVTWGERICGHIRGSKYISKRTMRHYCYKFQGWGIQKCIVEQLEKEKVFDIEIVYTDDQEIRLYHTTLPKFKENAIPARLSDVDGDQLFLPEEYWYTQRLPIGQINL